MVPDNVPPTQRWSLLQSPSQVRKATNLEVEKFPYVSYLELLKSHRQEYLFRNHGMVEVPLMNQALIERFQAQVACTLVSFNVSATLFIVFHR